MQFRSSGCSTHIDDISLWAPDTIIPDMENPNNWSISTQFIVGDLNSKQITITWTPSATTYNYIRRIHARNAIQYKRTPPNMLKFNRGRYGICDTEWGHRYDVDLGRCHFPVQYCTVADGSITTIIRTDSMGLSCSNVNMENDILTSQRGVMHLRLPVYDGCPHHTKPTSDWLEQGEAGIRHHHRPFPYYREYVMPCYISSHNNVYMRNGVLHCTLLSHPTGEPIIGGSHHAEYHTVHGANRADQ